MIIFPGKKTQPTWPEAYPEAIYGVSDNGWSDNELGTQWLKECFEPSTRHYGRPRLLIIDGHASHMTVSFLRFCWDHTIIPLCLPPHTTHFLQPLDVGPFNPISVAYKKHLEARNKVGLCFMDKLEFLEIFQQCRGEAFTQKNIMSGFAQAGKNSSSF